MFGYINDVEIIKKNMSVLLIYELKVFLKYFF